MYGRNGKRSSKWIAGLVLAISMLPIACGSDQGSEVNVIPKSEFLAKANAICERGTNKIDVLYTKAAAHVPKDDKGEHFMNEAAASFVIPIRRAELRKIRALGLPAGNEKTIEAFLAALQEGIERGERNHPSVRGSGGNEYAFEKAYLIGSKHQLGSCFRG
jgi:hypothetical protein